MSTQSIRTRRRAQALVGITAAVGMLSATPAFSKVDSPEPTATASATPVSLPSDVQLLKVNTSLLGTHAWYRQTVDGYPVVDGLYAQHTVTSGAAKGAVTVWDGRVSVGSLPNTAATVSSPTAINAAVAYTGGVARTRVAPSLWVLPGASTRLVWAVTTVTDGSIAQSHVTYVDAQTGVVVQSVVESQSSVEATTAVVPTDKYVKGRARTFDPNPVAKLQNEGLTDQNDANSAVPASAYSKRKLKHLDRSHTLVGKWAEVTNSDLASSPDDMYDFPRADDRFEQVMGYYALDTEESYYQELGFKDVNAEPQQISTNSLKADNSFYSPSQDMIETGTGGVDDAEDPEVVWHEAGHATQDAQVPGFGKSEEAGSIGEGFGDYMAVTLSQEFAKSTSLTPTTCVMDWDATSYTSGPKHCLRTTDTPKTYPDDLEGEVHADGEIWSHALWDMNQSLGRDKATTAIVEAQFDFDPRINMPDAASLIVDTTRTLYGSSAADKASKAFEDRGIL